MKRNNSQMKKNRRSDSQLLEEQGESDSQHQQLPCQTEMRRDLQWLREQGEGDSQHQQSL
jgi:hypothetical protein